MLIVFLKSKINIHNNQYKVIMLGINIYAQDSIHNVINFSKELFFILLSYLLFY